NGEERREARKAYDPSVRGTLGSYAFLVRVSGASAKLPSMLAATIQFAIRLGHWLWRTDDGNRKTRSRAISGSIARGPRAHALHGGRRPFSDGADQCAAAQLGLHGLAIARAYSHRAMGYR